MEKQKRPPLPLDASPQEKYNNLILTIFEKWQRFDGDDINVEEKLRTQHLPYYGFNTVEEFAFYINTLVKNNLLECSSNKISRVFVHDKEVEVYLLVKVSFQGLNYCLSLLESGKNSTRCFVAMAFSDDMERFYDNGIAQAIEGNGFRPIRVDKEHTDKEQTINDFIIASIKQSRFCIADLTYQRNGVYFEAGYALGRGLKVIYTCLRNDHKNVHFDLKTMQTILYDTPEELRDALDWKIKAVIKE